jgi:hypothetical protein
MYVFHDSMLVIVQFLTLRLTLNNVDRDFLLLCFNMGG